MLREPARALSTRTFALTLLAALLLAPCGAALAQTSDVWTNTKISDLRRHQGEVDSEAAEHYETAQRYMVKIDRLLGDEDRGKRQEKRLEKAFDKAIRELNAAIEAAPDWIEARLALGSVHYKHGDLEEARSDYEGILAVDPEHERARAYLGTVQYELARRDQQEQGGSDGGR
ncbi:MAG: tetratricopeptide repeat protein [Acidobacteriota bacterium]|jgi:tetratricopeptide (TPR) repeat protein